MIPGAQGIASGSTGLARLSAYGALRMPLALLELPLFVLLPSYYSGVLGLELAIVGTVLFACRLLDAVLDPALGAMIDGRGRWHWPFRHWIWFSLPVPAIGFFALLNPPADVGSLAAWLAITSIITYLGYSVASIAYQAWGAVIGQTDSERARVTGVREGFGLLGVLIASALLTPEGVPALVTLFIVLSAGCAAALVFAPMATRATSETEPDKRTRPWQWFTAPWQIVLDRPRFRWLLLIFLINGVATAIPATLVLFFIGDVLQASSHAPMFLGIYFLFGALGMPMWIWLVGRAGLRHAWLVGMAASVIAFVWALALGAGDVASFAAVCALTGLALGADLAVPPALLASVIASHDDTGRREGAYFGVWNFVTKLNLATAAGVSLPLLSLGGYEPGQTAVDAGTTLPLVYAALPCLLKLIAAAVLWFAPLVEPLHPPPLPRVPSP